MSADADDDYQPRRLRKRWRFAIGLVLVVAVAVAIAWSQRRDLAAGFVDRELARRGVPARYTVSDIGFSRQRLTNVVIGDPKAPDLVADWVEIGTEVGLGGPSVTRVSAGRVRIRARLVDGQVSLGAIDKLMPPPSGKPFALPRINARAEDLRVRLETPYGLVGIKMSGAGRLDDGFTGRLAAVSDRLELGGCVARRLATATSVRTAADRPSFEGPVRLGALDCGTARAAGLAAEAAVTLGQALDRWTGRARISAASAGGDGVTARQVMGRLSFDGRAARTAGDLNLTIAQLQLDGGAATGTTIAGRYAAGTSGLEFNGRAAAQRATLAPALLARVGAVRGSAAGTPAGPILDRIVDAVDVAARHMKVNAAVEAVVRGPQRAIRIAQLDLTAASGAKLRLAGSRLRFGPVEVGGRVETSGGGLPQAAIDLRQENGGIAGLAVIQPYQAGNARLALTPVRFASAGGVTTVATHATLSGPLGDGRAERLSLPIAARWAGTRLALNPQCAPLAWQRLSVAGLTLDPARLALCPLGGALVTIDRGRLGGGARIAAPRLTGRLGGTPLTLAAAGSELRLGEGGFSLSDVAARLGSPGRVTRIDAERLSGRFAGNAVAGSFAGAGGQIGNVPLLMSGAAGNWRMAGGVLTLGGRLDIADAAEEARFKPLFSDDVAMRLADDRITATGTLKAPKNNARIADVTIEHRLSNGAGRAVLDVPGIVFADKGLQPDDLTPITFGVIADVRGTVAGRGEIAWTADGVTSTGRFGTEGTDLAAAFGPVTGIKGDILFTDLLGLVSAPNQVATVATVNPGIAVENGQVRYQLVGQSRVQVLGAEWPFAGGRLELEPTLLDFGEAKKRHMTFRVVGVGAAGFLQQFDFDNVNATGVFDGTLPMVFDDAGGRIENGRLAAREGGGSLAYVGTLTEEDLGYWGNLAFQALKSLNYRNLGIVMNGPLAGEMVTEIRFAGVSQGTGTKSNFVIKRLAKLPFVFNITIRAPFRQLLDSVRSYYDPSRLIQRNLPALLEQRERQERERQQVRPPPPAPPAVPIQPSESENKP